MPDHLESNFESYENYLKNFADEVFTVDLSTLNNSTVNSEAIVAVDFDERTVNVALTAANLTPLERHVQHIHGLFDGTDADGNRIPADSQTPTLASDADQDGFIEVLEGVPSYGDIVLSLTNEDGVFPLTAADGTLTFIQSYSLDDPVPFLSPVTGTQYNGDDLLPLDLREIVVHGLVVPDGQGEGTGNEVDGGVNGYIPILPAAAGEIEAADVAQALDMLEDQQAFTGRTFMGMGDDDRLVGTIGDDMMDGGAGNDRLVASGGDDMMSGGDGDDTVFGQDGDDVMAGGAGNDVLGGGTGNDMMEGGAGMDRLIGQAGDDSLFGGDDADRLKGGEGDDLLVGGDGDDVISGNAGADIIGGGAGNDVVRGGAGADEFHLDAGTGTDILVDFRAGEDVISFLDDGAISFANSSENDTRGDSDLSAADYAVRDGVGDLAAADDQKVVELQMATTRGALLSDTSAVELEAYLIAFDNSSNRGVIAYDDDWSTAGGREIVAELPEIDTLAALQSLSVTDFDVY